MNVKGMLLACVTAFVAVGASAQTKWDMPTPYADGEFHTDRKSTRLNSSHRT